MKLCTSLDAGLKLQGNPREREIVFLFSELGFHGRFSVSRLSDVMGDVLLRNSFGVIVAAKCMYSFLFAT